MAIIDSQVHVYEANTPQRPWHTVPNWPAHVTGDEMVAAMDTVGGDGAIFISAFSLYQYDASYPDIWEPLARVRGLGVRPLPVEHRLDSRLRGRQLRAGRRTLPPDRPPERQ